MPYVTEQKCDAQQTSSSDPFNQKVSDFCSAMEKYHNNPIYTRVELLVAILVVALQILTLFNLVQRYNGTSVITLFIAFIISYGVTDFVNGFIHMMMDNNTFYSSIVGPFISSFHLHHSKPRSTYRSTLKVYFYESRTKFWLLGYLLVLSLAQKVVTLPYALNFGLVSVGILSSVAEVSHYWCHNSTSKNKVIQKLQRWGLLLSKKHHANHHRSDNTHYAFLNGMADPLLNRISKYFFKGYKNEADKHTSAYVKLTQEIK